MHRTLALALLLGSALAQNLVSLAPPGAVAGFYLADLRGSPYLQGFAADWKASGMEALLGRELRQQVGQAVDLLGLAAGGLVAAAYPDGFFVLGRPSPGALEALRKEARGLQSLGGWQVGGDKEVQIGLSRELFFVASPKYAQLFLQNRRGLGAPARGDLVFWGSLPQGLAQDLGLPPRTSSALRALGRFTYSLQLSPGGYTEEARLELNPTLDPTLARLLLPKERPYDPTGLPQGYSVTTGVFDLAQFATYLKGLLSELNIPLELDLKGFSPRYALVSVKGPPPAPDGRGEGLLGHTLVYWEVKDPALAEANLLALMRALAAFSTPEGQGGFRTLGSVGGFKAVELGLAGVFYYRLEPDRLVLATSKSALEATANPPWGRDPGFRRFRVRMPANAIGFTYTDQGALMREQAALLAGLLPQAIGQTEGFERRLGQALAGFLERVAQRFGPGLSYTVVEGHRRVSRGFYEMRW
ncbi:hypothetical protein Mlute_01343 [Meiothermus luteus]|uniref:DUF3352 domain-containing protein n=1 Tax=Meiothermus luteus TaxID=2026184 RepID=A0A399ENJ6_9DEIN|nr:hypothetical protein [Meiothermus luteus]RIH86187.1 hypothetical protein Mlute_01343 [Meiothermus luteus]RMH54438.1 MAG: hypothetical protein D6684_09770 [Deinococcota bacterium]